MLWEFKDDRPLYIQIIDHIKLGIISGEYEPGSRLLSVRELAEEASVNPNTMQKALSELEREGLVYARRTMGRFITEDADMVNQIKESLAKEQVKKFFDKMRAIGYSVEDTIEFLTNAAKEGE